MFLVRNGEIKVKPSTHPTRVSLEWRDLEYDIADMWTMDDGSKRLDFMSHLDPRRATSMDEFIRDGTVKVNEVWIDPTKVDEPGRDKWEAILARCTLPPRLSRQPLWIHGFYRLVFSRRVQ